MRSVKPRAGLWQVAQLITPLAEMRGSKNSILPSSTFTAVWLLSAGIGAMAGKGSKNCL